VLAASGAIRSCCHSTPAACEKPVQKLKQLLQYSSRDFVPDNEQQEAKLPLLQKGYQVPSGRPPFWPLISCANIFRVRAIQLRTLDSLVDLEFALSLRAWMIFPHETKPKTPLEQPQTSYWGYWSQQLKASYLH